LKLFYSSETTSVPAVIAIEYAQIECSLVEVSWQRNVNMEELHRYNPLGKVGTLVLDDGKVLTQNLAILAYLADLRPAYGLLGLVGSYERAATLSLLSLGATDLFAAISLGFRRKRIVADASAQEHVMSYAQARLTEILSAIELALHDSVFIGGDTFTIADCYMASVLPMAQTLALNFDQYIQVRRYLDQLATLQAVIRGRSHGF
jgi:glutathione S-transferase